jgi:hypothetical protein
VAIVSLPLGCLPDMPRAALLILMTAWSSSRGMLREVIPKRKGLGKTGKLEKEVPKLIIIVGRMKLLKMKRLQTHISLVLRISSTFSSNP